MTPGLTRRALLLGSAGTLAATARAPAQEETLRFELTCTLDPEKGLRGRAGLFFPVPTPALPYQTATFELPGVSGWELRKSFGNDVVFIKAPPAGPFPLVIRVEKRRYPFRKELAAYDAAAPLPPDVTPYLGVSRSLGRPLDPGSPAVQRIVRGLTGPTPLQTVRNIHAWQKQHMTYKGDASGTIEQILERGYGECNVWSSVFTVFCRAAAIPAREVTGYMRVDANGLFDDHVWAEFYLPGSGWIPAEPQDEKKLGDVPLPRVRVCHRSIENGWTESRSLRLMGGSTARSRALP